MSLENILGPEYRLVLELNAATTISHFCDEYLQGTAPENHKRIERFKRKWGEHFLGEIPPKLASKQPFWDIPVPEKNITDDMRRGLKDKHFQQVLNTAETGYTIDPNNVKAGDVLRLVHVQQLGIANRTAHQKKDDIVQFINKLNDAAVYKTVRNKIKRILPELDPYLPEKPHQFTLLPYKESIVKAVHSGYRKINNYMPTKNDYNNFCKDRKKEPKGIFRIKDASRISIKSKSGRKQTWEQRIEQRNQIFAFVAVLGMDLNFMKDHVSNAARSPGKPLPWPACMYHGKQYYPLTDNENNKTFVGLSNEIQFVDSNDYYKNQTVVLRTSERKKEQIGSDKARQRLIDQMWTTTMPDVRQAVEEQKPDPSYTIILDYLADKRETTMPHGHMVDLSGSTSLEHARTNYDTRFALKKMIRGPGHAKQ